MANTHPNPVTQCPPTERISPAQCYNTHVFPGNPADYVGLKFTLLFHVYVFNRIAFGIIDRQIDTKNSHMANERGIFSVNLKPLCKR